ncbi:MAG TPA: ABC transporter substrate binding protein [candidate division Zixibacteria bacterium]|nr:ABC transporter substrate binding protein [candidate division Zixibacteria bacterium]
MPFRFAVIFALIGSLLLPAASPEAVSSPKTRFNIGFFEAGLAHQHDALRTEFVRQLRAIVPDTVEIVTIARGYREASWYRDSCRIKAAELAAEPNLDLMITLGPWVVEDLIEAGYEGPILALYRVDPMMEQLLDSTGRPRWDNLTVHYQPTRIARDLAVMAQVLKPKRVGFLFFPSGEEYPYLFAQSQAAAQQNGMELVNAIEYNNFGTYAFYKTYAVMRNKVDAVYLGPLWGLPSPRTKDFLKMLNNEGIPTFSYDGSEAVIRGAVVSNTGISVASEARYQADKAWKILKGAVPANLPIYFEPSTGLTINGDAARQCHVQFPNWVSSQAVYLAPAQEPDAVSYTLTDAVRRALDQHPEALARQDAVTAAQAAASEAWSGYLPQVGFEYRYRHNDDHTVANTENEIDQDQTRATLSLSQPILSLTTIRSAKAAEQAECQAEIDLARTDLDLELAVAQAYLGYLSATRRVDIEKDLARRILRNQELADARYELDKRMQFDFLRWEQEYQQASAALHQAEAARSAARAAFNSLMNMPPDQPIDLAPAPFGQANIQNDLMHLAAVVDDPVKWQRFQEYLIDKARRINPELRSYDNQVLLGQRLLDLNRAGFFPTISAEGAVHYTDELANRPGIFEEKHDTWYLGAALHLPLFSGGERFRERSRLKAELSRDEWTRDARMLDLAGRISSQMSLMASSGLNLPNLIDAEKLAGLTVDMVQEDYEAGRTTYLHLLDALRNLRQSQTTTLEMWQDYFTRLAELVRLIGWSSHDASTTYNNLFYNEAGKFLKSVAPDTTETP